MTKLDPFRDHDGTLEKADTWLESKLKSKQEAETTFSRRSTEVELLHELIEEYRADYDYWEQNLPLFTEIQEIPYVDWTPEHYQFQRDLMDRVNRIKTFETRLNKICYNH